MGNTYSLTLKINDCMSFMGVSKVAVSIATRPCRGMTICPVRKLSGSAKIKNIYTKSERQPKNNTRFLN